MKRIFTVSFKCGIHGNNEKKLGSFRKFGNSEIIFTNSRIHGNGENKFINFNIYGNSGNIQRSSIIYENGENIFMDLNGLNRIPYLSYP